MLLLLVISYLYFALCVNCRTLCVSCGGARIPVSPKKLRGKTFSGLYRVRLSAFCIAVYAYWDLGPLVYFIGLRPSFLYRCSRRRMPPKRKVAEKEDEHEERDGFDTGSEITSPISSASTGSTASSLSTRSSVALTAEQLQQILENNSMFLQNNQKAMLEANERSITALLATLSPGAGGGSGSSRGSQVKVPKWTDDEVPFDYFSKFEKALKHNGVPSSSWGQLLPIYLTGRAQAALAQVNLEVADDYEVIKVTLLDSLGDTPVSADRKWWTLSRLPSEEPSQFYLRVRSIGLRKLHGLKERDEFVEHIVLSRFMSLLPSECYNFVSAKQPKTGLEAAKMVQEYEETRHFSRRKQPWKDSGSYYKRENSSSTPSGNGSSGVGAKESTGNQKEGSNNSGHGKVQKGDRQHRRPIICHGCGEPGHIKPNCPNRIRRVKSPTCESHIEVEGWLAGESVKGMKVDTGADRSVISGEYFPESAYLDRTVILDSWRGKQFSKHKLARLSLQVGDTIVDAVFAVADKLDCPALLGKDLGPDMMVQLLGMMLEEAKTSQGLKVSNAVNMQDSEVVESAPVRVTRAQAARQRKEEEGHDLASAESGSSPLELSDIFGFEDGFFYHDPTPVSVDECEVLPEVEEVVIPLPQLPDAGSDDLITEQQADISLKPLLALAEKKGKGYSLLDGILVHTVCDELGDDVVRILVPTGRRLGILEMAHTHMLAGHFGGKKTFARVSARFLWPKMWLEVKRYVKTCIGCQRASRKDRAKAPLQPLQVESEPFSKVAFDLVGPLPRSTSGFRYVLTMMDLYSKFPAAIPLKRVDNDSVIEAMLEVFASYGLPKVLLTDQGSVFTSKLTKAMCKQFGIDKIRTSPYHPQSDGALERWHACLKGMLKRSQCNLKLWDKELTYLLFAYRSTPHVVTGFAPFTLMFGRAVRGPLEILQEAWLQGDCKPAQVHEWLVDVKAKMAELSQLVSAREAKAKEKMKATYDKGASVKSFEPGEMVLVWKPGIHAKMGASWDGPFQIKEKVSPVTYRVMVPGRAKLSKVLHCNLLRRWSSPAARVHRVAIVQEEEESVVEGTNGLKLGREGFVPTELEQASLDSVLASFPEVLHAEPGRTTVVALKIDTEGHKPISSHPYRIAPRWKEEVKRQVDQLLEWGIIRPSVSPWSSSLVTVQKKDGGVRLCIDFRAVNECTQPDPYQMPLIDEILEVLASARFISKVDLNKGFHQIPVVESDVAKTAFCTPWGKYEFVVMPFGLRNGPAVFQRMMDQVLSRDRDVSVVYIDDIAIFSATWEDHCRDISRILGRLQEAGLTANVKKCMWGQTRCQFLGHLVGGGMVSPADLKVSAVRTFSQPKTKKHVKQFLGLTGYYRKFISHYAEHSFHLTETTRKSAPDKVAWTGALDEEFIYLKDCLCSLPSLTLPVVQDVFLLQTDASGVGLGAVLSVVREGVELPVAYFSRKLLPRERNYSASELEGLAVVAAVRHFDAYLLPHPFTLVTDHRALLFLNTTQQGNGRLARWAIQLQPFTFKVKYRKGSEHINADSLSRYFEEDDSSSLPDVFDLKEGGEMLGSLLPSSIKTPNMGRLEPAAQTVPDELERLSVICVTPICLNYCQWDIQP